MTPCFQEAQAASMSYSLNSSKRVIIGDYSGILGVWTITPINP